MGDVDVSSSKIWAVAGAAVVVSCLLTARLVYQHLRNWRFGQRQRLIVRIVLMVPIYAIDSFLSLVFVKQSILFDVPRDCYESFVIYNFMALLVDYMGGEEAAQQFLARQLPLKHSFPCTCLGYHTMKDFLSTCKVCVLQYSLVKPITAILTLAFHWAGLYKPGDFALDSARFWICVINNSSVTLALYYLVAFYHATHNNAPLNAGNPLPKFVAVKIVIFFAFWQQVVIEIVAAMGLVERTVKLNEDQVEVAWGDLCICLEMALVAVGHAWVFSADEHRHGFYGLLDDTDAEQGVMQVELGPRQAARKIVGVEDLVVDVESAAKHLPQMGKNVTTAWRQCLFPNDEVVNETMARRSKPRRGLKAAIRELDRDRTARDRMRWLLRRLAPDAVERCPRHVRTGQRLFRILNIEVRPLYVVPLDYADSRTLTYEGAEVLLVLLPVAPGGSTDNLAAMAQQADSESVKDTPFAARVEWTDWPPSGNAVETSGPTSPPFETEPGCLMMYVGSSEASEGQRRIDDGDAAGGGAADMLIQRYAVPLLTCSDSSRGLKGQHFAVIQPETAGWGQTAEGAVSPLHPPSPVRPAPPPTCAAEAERDSGGGVPFEDSAQSPGIPAVDLYGYFDDAAVVVESAVGPAQP